MGRLEVKQDARGRSARPATGTPVVAPSQPRMGRSGADFSNVPLRSGGQGRPLPSGTRASLEDAFSRHAVTSAAPAGRVSRPGDAGEREAERVARDVSAVSPTQGPSHRGAAPDFGSVRVHTGPQAAAAAGRLGAAAYTVGDDVVLGGGARGSGEQLSLLAHELTHVLQQRRQGTTSVQRQAVPGTGGQAPAALQLIPGDNLAASRAVMRAIDGLVATPDGRFTTTYQGQTLSLTQEQADRARATARKAVADVLAKARGRFDMADSRYQAQKSVDKDHWFVSSAVHGYAWVRTLGEHEDPGMLLTLHRTAVALADAEARRDLSAGHFAGAAEAAARSEMASGRAAALVRVYIDQTIEGGESLATGLEYTRDAAFITLGVLAVVVSGGAAAGLAPEVVGTGIGGLTVGGTATAISVGAPIVANVGVGVAKTVAGDPVDWGAIAVDAGVQIVLAKFGGKLGEGVFGRLAGNAATRTVARKALASVLSGVLTHEVGQAFTTSVHGVYEKLRGRPMTWGQFVDELATRLSDPNGIFIAAAMSGFQLAAHGAIDKAASRAPSKQPAQTHVEPTAKRPPPTVHESPPKPVHETPPAELAQKRATPSSTTASRTEGPPQQHHLDGPPVVEPAPKPVLGPVNTPVTKPVTKPVTTPVTDAEAELTGVARTAPTDKATHPADVSPGARTQAELRAQNIAALKDVPDLQAAVSTGTKYPGVGDLAEIPPPVLRRTWEEYQAYSAKKLGQGEQPLTFPKYVKSLQDTHDRATFGEVTDAFGRGNTEIMVQAPGTVNEKGIDSISYAPATGRVKLLDNKAYARNVGKVSALQQNLNENLADSVTALRAVASQPGVPPELGKVVLPRLEAASKAVDAHVTAWKAANPTKPLTDPELQAQLGKILDQHGIDRVVTTEGGKAGVGVTSRLSKQGFTHE